MKISKTIEDRQLPLFDTRKTTLIQCTHLKGGDQENKPHGQVRTIVGNFFEDITQLVLGGRRHKTDCQADYCPDISAGSDYYEVKAAGRTNQTFIYEGRLEKDNKFCNLGHSLYYFVWHHKLDTKQYYGQSIHDLETGLLNSIVGQYRIRFQDIYKICKSKKAEKLNSQYGGPDKKTYGAGYRINISEIKQYDQQLAKIRIA
jgi:hypothetical protein